MALYNIPVSALRHYAEALISNKDRPKLTRNRPASKVRLLRDMMLADPAVAAKVKAMHREAQMKAIATKMTESGLAVNPDAPTVALPPEKQDPVYLSWAPEVRRAWRLIWAVEAVRSGAAGPNHSEWGGDITAEERQTAKLIIAGELKPTALLFDDCDGTLHKCEPGTTPDGWDENYCPDPNCHSKTRYLGHFHHVLYPTTN
jgi:hypothetical protein